MEVKELNEKIAALSIDHKTALNKLYREYAYAHNPIGVGDIVRDHYQIRLVEKIKWRKTHNKDNPADCVYFGPRLKKDLTPYVKQDPTEGLYQCNLKQIIKKAPVVEKKPKGLTAYQFFIENLPVWNDRKYPMQSYETYMLINFIKHVGEDAFNKTWQGWDYEQWSSDICYHYHKCHRQVDMYDDPYLDSLMWNILQFQKDKSPWTYTIFQWRDYSLRMQGKMTDLLEEDEKDFN